ncbi:MAG: flagellar basal body P-ring protein FlgI, partial [Halanaerobium sp.]|nr:flagellar basal body P-ring protein FlgI [Halanaerobium sp.]
MVEQIVKVEEITGQDQQVKELCSDKKLLVLDGKAARDTKARRSKKAGKENRVNGKMVTHSLLLFLFLTICVWSLSPVVGLGSTPNNPLVKIGDITHIQGIRDNQLLGYGLIVGLAGTGDGMRFRPTIQSLANMMNNMGIKVEPDDINSKNVASVMVTAELPPFAQPGDTIDVTVSSLGDADSLQGGTLLLTPLKAPNGEVYAVAQGPLSIGGFNYGSGGESVQENHPTVGRIPNGAIIERGLDINLSSWRDFELRLDTPNFETSQRVATAINGYFSQPLARAEDSAQIHVEIPMNYAGQVVGFISELHSIMVRPAVAAKIIINERTGTIVMGHQVRISTVVVSYGNLTVEVSTQLEVVPGSPGSDDNGESNAGSGGDSVAGEGDNSNNPPVVVKDKEMDVEKGQGELVLVPANPTIEDLVRALNSIGATPRDIIN